MGVWGYEWHDKPMRNKAVTRATFDPFAFRVISKPCLHHDVLYHRLGRSKTASKIEGVASRKPWYVMA
jgi:hypothetical protein